MQKQFHSFVMVGVLVALISVSAFLRIPMPWGMPLTLQMFMILITPMVFGAKISFAAVALYIVLGLIGFPIFASGGGPAYLFHISFGYLVGFLFSTIPSGLICGKSSKIPLLFAGGLIAYVLIEALGTAGMWANLNFYQKKEVAFLTVAKLYALPYFLPDFIKLVCAVIIGSRLKKLLTRQNLLS